MSCSIELHTLVKVIMDTAETLDLHSHPTLQSMYPYFLHFSVFNFFMKYNTAITISRVTILINVVILACLFMLVLFIVYCHMLAAFCWFVLETKISIHSSCLPITPKQGPVSASCVLELKAYDTMPDCYLFLCCGLVLPYTMSNVK